MSATESDRVYAPAKPDVNLPAQEEAVLSDWDARRIFEKTVDATSGKKPYSFYDGPPFATGLPHYGHLLAGILKDIVPRYWTMRGYSIPRRFGWDCHGLPVEFEINKKLSIDNRKQVLEMGIDKYNAECRSIVRRYTEEWKATVRRIGRWVDMEDPYHTMDTTFMQSVWWVFQQLWNKGLIYEGHKVLPYSVGVSTPLSNFEANQNYKDVQDPAITVKLQDRERPDLYYLVWTTTPWTLPSNLAIAVGDDLDYVEVAVPGDGNYVLAKALLDKYFDTGDQPGKKTDKKPGKKPGKKTDKKPGKKSGKKKSKGLAGEVVREMKGSELVGASYHPLFPFFADHERAFRVVSGHHVTEDSGTGIVHMAPAFGEDDYLICKNEQIAMVNPVDDDGMFTDEVPDWTGLRVKEADPHIIAKLKDQGSMFKHDTIVHSYPFCWRSDTPLIYRAVSTWFVNVEAIKDKILAANAGTSWVPEHLRDGRMGKWLENARDWAVSRNRFWGTPLPIWTNGDEAVCVGSIDELAELSGVRIDDLHLDVVIGVEIPAKNGGPPLTHVGTVLDCWFESGSMPYAQFGYPFTNKDTFEAGFPADFIAEGLDQTRGWFYTLTVLGAALFGKSPFKNVVVNGLILAEDGKKMSKRLRNYPDPNGLLDRHGADALRLYLIDSPVVKAQELRFVEKGVRDIVRKILLRWWNAYSFYVSYANIDAFVPRGDHGESPNILDQWILSRLHTLIARTNREMNGYRLYNVVPGLLDFIEDLTNTYIRFNRPHFWREGMPEDKRLAFETLHHVLVTLAEVMAPFTPFLAEVTYRNLSQVSADARESVHLEDYPLADESLLRPQLEGAVARMTQVMLMGRNARERIGVKAKIPLLSLRIIHRDAKVLDALRPLETYIVDELNVRAVHYASDEDNYVQISTKANFPRLGPRLGKRMKLVAGAIARLTVEQVVSLENGATLTLEDEPITVEDIDIRRTPKDESQTLLTHHLVSIELDPTVSEEQRREGLAREVIRRIQMARKSADLQLDNRIALQLQCGAEIAAAIAAHRSMIMDGTLSRELTVVEGEPAGDHRESATIDDMALELGFSVSAK